MEARIDPHQNPHTTTDLTDITHTPPGAQQGTATRAAPGARGWETRQEGSLNKLNFKRWYLNVGLSMVFKGENGI